MNPQPGRPSPWALAYKYATLTLVWAYVASIFLRGDDGCSPALEIGLVNTVLLLLAASLWVRALMPNPNRGAIAWLAVATSGYLLGNLAFAAYTLTGVPAPLPSVADIGYSLAFLDCLWQRPWHCVVSATAMMCESSLDVILGFLGAVVLASVLLRPVIETLLQTTSSACWLQRCRRSPTPVRHGCAGNARGQDRTDQGLRQTYVDLRCRGCGSADDRRSGVRTGGDPWDI